MRFLAIDFETANNSPESACAIGLVLVEYGRIIEKKSFLIRPESSYFPFTHIHGIYWEDVKEAPTFGELWPCISEYFEDIDFIAAHNAPFDRRVLVSCCDAYNIAAPEAEFRCTVRLSRSVLNFRPANLPSVCERLSIPLTHHDALSDTLACAKIMIKILEKEAEDGLFINNSLSENM